MAGNVGQGDELEGLEQKAYKTGADKFYAAALSEEMVNDVVIPSMQAGAIYEEYLMGTAFARPIIAKKLVEMFGKNFTTFEAHVDKKVIAAAPKMAA